MLYLTTRTTISVHSSSKRMCSFPAHPICSRLFTTKLKIDRSNTCIVKSAFISTIYSTRIICPKRKPKRRYEETIFLIGRLPLGDGRREAVQVGRIGHDSRGVDVDHMVACNAIRSAPCVSLILIVYRRRDQTYVFKL